jgi:hypothetical protein
MITVICVLKSGGLYDAGWVRKLRDSIARKTSMAHRFMCLTDTPVDCEMLDLLHDLPCWWSKLELFRPGVIDGPTLYLDLDNVPVGDIAALVPQPHEFAMIRNFNRPAHASSCLMWFAQCAPAVVWDKFIADPQHWIAYHKSKREGAYFGDQAFIWDAMDRACPLLDYPRTLVAHYRKDVAPGMSPPQGASLVVFSGSVKPTSVREPWIAEAWA